jgi:hypothetical protein
MFCFEGQPLPLRGRMVKRKACRVWSGASEHWNRFCMLHISYPFSVRRRRKKIVARCHGCLYGDQSTTHFPGANSKIVSKWYACIVRAGDRITSCVGLTVLREGKPLPLIVSASAKGCDAGLRPGAASLPSFTLNPIGFRWLRSEVKFIVPSPEPLARPANGLRYRGIRSARTYQGRWQIRYR